MKRTHILYWVFTILLVPMFGIGSVVGLIDPAKSVAVLTSLGYPGYLSAFLCVARIIALIVIFLPYFSRLKEWAYAGLAIDVIGAIYSLIVVRQAVADIIFPVIALGIVLASYFLWHKRKRTNGNT